MSLIDAGRWMEIQPAPEEPLAEALRQLAKLVEREQDEYRRRVEPLLKQMQRLHELMPAPRMVYIITDPRIVERMPHASEREYPIPWDTLFPKQEKPT